MVSPFKQRYGDSNTTIEGVAAKLQERDLQAPLPDAAAELASAELGASEPTTVEPEVATHLATPHPEMYTGSLGCRYPVDSFWRH